jgi:hypothetical protein
MSQDSKPSVSRSAAIKRIAVVPVVAAGIVVTASQAQAADNKKQFKYQDSPAKNGQKCSQCRLFKAPSGCQVVTGKISPSGWCIAWVKR